VIAYFDTSALVKRMIDEPGSDVADEVWRAADVVVSSELVYPEARAAMAAAQRAGRIGPKRLRQLVRSLDDVFDTLEVLEFERILGVSAGVLAERHGLRGYDAVHLASALSVPVPRIVVTTWDADLSAACTPNGVGVVPQRVSQTR
jgi:predicted nucleic acid-binding protein